MCLLRKAVRVFAVPFGVATVFIALCASYMAGADELSAQTAPSFQTGVITLDLGVDQITVPVEVALSNHQRRYGLMHRTELPAGQGMIFVFEEAAIRSFWMKSTLIPLDMLFFDAEGRLVNIIRDVPPLSLTSRRSTKPAKYVVELNAGEARSLGIHASSKLVLPIGGVMK